MSTWGSFTEGQAKCIARGGYDQQRGGEASIADEWAVTLPAGTRPVASQIAGLPKIGQAAGAAGSGVLAKMFVSSISWRQAGEHSRVWIATVKYSPGSRKTTSQSSPDAATYYNKRWGFRTVSADLVQDAVDGRAVVNSAGEPFDSVPQRDMFLPVVSFSMLSSAAPATLSQYTGTVNAEDATILGVAFAAHCARMSIECRNLDPEEVEGEGATTSRYEYQVTVEGAHTMYSGTAPADGSAPSPEDLLDIGWDVSALDCGYCERRDGALAPILVDGERPQAPVPLSGGVKADDDENLTFLRFAAYPEATWPDILTPA